MEMSFSWR